jgi:signal transduction histidine kinase
MDVQRVELHPCDSRGSQTVLVADDRQHSRQSTQRLLEGDGRRVLTAASSGEAVDVFVHERAAVLVVAMTLLETGGRELIRRARAMESGLPVIVQHDGLDARSRRQLIRDLDLQAVHERGRDPSQLLEVIECALASLRGMRRARAIQDLRAQILAKLCHELRASLVTIQGYAEILQVDDGAPRGEILPRLAAASSTATELTHRYLTLAQLDANRVLVRREHVEIDALVEELRLFAERRIGGRPLHFDAHVPAGHPYLETDGEKLRAILVELLANAVKFCPAGEICLAIRRESERTEFVLTDTGPGIHQPALAELCNPFCQSNDHELTTTPGQGLGLAIAVRLSALIGASLTTTSSRLTGARFTLTVPAPLRQTAAAVTLH